MTTCLKSPTMKGGYFLHRPKEAPFKLSDSTSRLDMQALFALERPIWEMVLRGTAVYWFLFLLFRFILRRDVRSMGVADLLFVVLVMRQAMPCKAITRASGMDWFLFRRWQSGITPWTGWRFIPLSSGNSWSHNRRCSYAMGAPIIVC